MKSALIFLCNPDFCSIAAINQGSTFLKKEHLVQLRNSIYKISFHQFTIRYNYCWIS